MVRETIYSIGRKKMEAQMVGEKLNIELAGGDRNDNFVNSYYYVMFGKDDKDRMYMVLATEVMESGEYHGPKKIGGHWHGGGCNWYIRQYNIKLRKNFTDKDEANRYYNIVKTNLYMRTVQDEHTKTKLTEDQINRLFS